MSPLTDGPPSSVQDHPIEAATSVQILKHNNGMRPSLIQAVNKTASSHAEPVVSPTVYDAAITNNGQLPTLTSRPLVVAIAMGLTIPCGKQADDIIASYHHYDQAFRAQLSPEGVRPSFTATDKNVLGAALSIGTDGVPHRFLHMTPAQLVENFNNDPNAPGPKVLPTNEPVNLFHNGSSVVSNCLYTSDGYIVVLDIEERIMASQHIDPTVASGKGPRTVPANKQHVPKPMNAFILYRKYKTEEVKMKYPGIGNNEISKIIGKEWRELPQETKDYFKVMAHEIAAKQEAALKINHPAPSKSSKSWTYPGRVSALPSFRYQKRIRSHRLQKPSPNVALLHERWILNPSDKNLKLLLKEIEAVLDRTN